MWQVRATQTLSYVSEGAIFLYVGMDTLDPLKWKVRPHVNRPAPMRARTFRMHSSGMCVLVLSMSETLLEH